mgnify:CR=1 FL=1
MLGLPFGEGKPPSSVFERFLDAMDDMPLTWSVGRRRVVIKLVVVADAPCKVDDEGCAGTTG